MAKKVIFQKPVEDLHLHLMNKEDYGSQQSLPKLATGANWTKSPRGRVCQLRWMFQVVQFGSTGLFLTPTHTGSVFATSGAESEFVWMCVFTQIIIFFVEDKRKQTNKLLSNMCFAIRTLTFTSQKRPTSEGMALHHSYFVFVSVCGCENVWSCVCVF